MPEKQTAWNSDNQGTKEKNQPEQPDLPVRQRTTPARLAQKNLGKVADRSGGADLRGK